MRSGNTRNPHFIKFEPGCSSDKNDEADDGIRDKLKLDFTKLNLETDLSKPCYEAAPSKIHMTSSSSDVSVHDSAIDAEESLILEESKAHTIKLEV
jgi:hypothetical protein